jgi:hypothetical protein
MLAMKKAALTIALTFALLLATSIGSARAKRNLILK